ncbi:MAG: flagellar motor switch protein FliG [Pseudomonadota bacterium]
MTAKTVTSPDQLSGAERAAVVMLALGEDSGKPLWESFDEDELRELTLAITNLGSVTADVVESLLFEFVKNLSATGTITGSVDSARRFLKNILPEERVATILEDIKGPAGRTMWDKLANVNERTLAGYLRNEHPQTVAVILSRIRPEHAAKVLSALPERDSEEVMNRMLSLGPVQKEVLDRIEQTLRTEFMAGLARAPEKDCYESMAEIFNNFDRAMEKRFLETLEAKNPTAAEKIKSLMFVFEDLARLDGSAVQILLRHVDKSVLATALKGADETMRTLFFSNISERASTILRDDIDIMGPVRVREVEQAQQQIVQTAKQLAENGEIYLSKNADDEVIY